VTVCAVTLLPTLTTSTLITVFPTLMPLGTIGHPGAVVLAIVQACLGLLLVRYVLFARGETPADIGFRPGLRPVLESLPLTLAAYAGALAVVLALHGAVMAGAETQRARTAFMTTSPWLALVYVFVGPLFEETIVRAYLMTRLLAFGMSVTTVVLATAVLQTAYHTYQGLAWSLVYLPIFLVFATYFAWRRNAVTPAVSHVTIDLVSWLALQTGWTTR
jgi:membrane protease YdiL (CAAX protease family)